MVTPAQVSRHGPRCWRTRVPESWWWLAGRGCAGGDAANGVMLVFRVLPEARAQA
jgi:hypothetical protein